MSRKLLFFDIILVESDGGEKGGGGETRQTVVLKSWTGPDLVDRANRGPDKLHVGDLVHVTGCWEAAAAGSPGEFAASNFSVTERWAARHPTESFRPIPPPQSGGTVKVEKVGDVHGGGQLCKFFLNTGRCAAEEGCRFRHHSGDKRSSLVRDRVDYVGARLAARRQRHEAEFPPDTRLCSAARRAEIFGGWIVERFGGAAHLRSGIILDVAGGRGDLSFELAVKLGLNCWTVDPRPQKFRRWQLKMLGAADQNGSSMATRPVHKQEYFSRDFFAKCGLDPGLVRLVVGLHPDEATEPLVDIALELSLPLAVVPCCIFSHQFPARRLRSGHAPATFHQFCAYLGEKSDNIRTERLPFLGKNLVLFTPAAAVATPPSSINLEEVGEK